MRLCDNNEPVPDALARRWMPICAICHGWEPFHLLVVIQYRMYQPSCEHCGGWHGPSWRDNRPPDAGLYVCQDCRRDRRATRRARGIERWQRIVEGREQAHEILQDEGE
jgi:hypothetical protein